MRGNICAHFGWTYDYLLWGIPWILVSMFIADAPGYEYDNNEDNKSKNTQRFELTKENALDFFNIKNSSDE